MSSFDPAELAERTLDHLNKYIVVADQKASILLTAQFAFLGFGTTIVIDVISDASSWFEGVAFIGAGLGLIGAFFAGLVIYPRTPKAKKGLVFWEHITEFESRSRYQDAFEELDDKSFLRELTKQNYSLAKVANEKYCWLRWSLIFTAGMVVCAVIAMGIYLS